MKKIIFWVYALLVVVTPLIMYPYTSELFEFNKLIIIYFLASLVLLYWAIDSFIHKHLLIPTSLSYIPFVLFFITQLLSTFFSIDRHTSLFGYYGRFNGGLLSIIAYGILWLGLCLYITPSQIRKLIVISLIVSVGVMAWGLPGHFGHDISCVVFAGQWSNACWSDQFRPAERMFSTLGQPNWLGAYLAIHIFLVFYFYIEKKLKKENIAHTILVLLYFFLAFSCLLFTRSRSSFAAVGIGLVLYIPCIFLIRKKEIVGKIALVLLVGGLSIFVWKTGIPALDTKIELPFLHTQTQPSQATSTPSEQIISQVTPIPGSDITDSLDIRKIVWKGAIELGQKYPLFGTGVETFAYAYYFTRPIEHNLTSEWDYLYNKAHNEYLNYFATTGYVGLASYLVMIIATYISIAVAIWEMRKESKNDEYKNKVLWLVSLGVAYTTILITNYAGFSTTVTSIFFFLIPAMIWVISDQTKVAELNKRKSVIFVSVLSALVALIMGAKIVMYWYADVLYAQAETYVKAQEYQYAIRLYQQALGFHNEHVYEDKISFALANVSVLFASEKQQKEADTLMQLASYYNDDSLKQSPYNVIYWKTKSKNLYLYYQVDNNASHIQDAITALERATILSPTDPKIPYSSALFYAVLYDEEKSADMKKTIAVKSMENINRSIVLKSDYRDAYMLKGQLLKKYGDNVEAQKVFDYVESIFGPAPDIEQERAGK